LEKIHTSTESTSNSRETVYGEANNVEQIVEGAPLKVACSLAFYSHTHTSAEKLCFDGGTSFVPRPKTHLRERALIFEIPKIVVVIGKIVFSVNNNE
jgi:hypothetical protein